MITVKGGVINPPDMANRTRMRPGMIPPVERSIPGGFPGGGLPPNAPLPPSSDAQRNMLSKLMAPSGFADWTPEPTAPWGGLDMSNWKNLPLQGNPMEYLGNRPMGMDATDLANLQLFGNQMWNAPGRSAGSIVGNRMNRP